MIERCEYNPTTKKAAFDPPEPGACLNPATVCVGSKSQWHLCASCAELPEFKRFKKKIMTRNSEKSS